MKTFTLLASVGLGLSVGAIGQEQAGKPATRPGAAQLSEEDQRLVEGLLRAATAERDAQILEWRKRIEDLQRQLNPAKERAPRARTERDLRSSPQEKRREIGELRQQIRKLEKSRDAFTPHLPDAGDWHLGAIGQPRGTDWVVCQVIDADTMLVACYYVQEGVETIGSQQYIRRRPARSRSYMVRGLSTRGLVDGARPSLEDYVLYIDDTVTYETADGSNTTFVLRPVSDPVLTEFKRRFPEYIRKHGRKP